jgi:hypothetical protein
MKYNGPIDFVIPWVDGNDPDWRNERSKWCIENEGDHREIRFRDWDNLQYWFRGVEKFAPWVNRIHFITYGHLPPWLNVDHPKINIVRHTDYIPKKYLPTFNANVIELNIHRIEGLANCFVYFNDDTFIISKMRQTDFFVNGLPCDAAIIRPYISEFKNSIAAIIANVMEVINTNFDKGDVIRNNFFKYFNLAYRRNNFYTLLSLPYRQFVGFSTPHLPNSFLKSTFNELWEKEYHILDSTCKHKFRNKADVNQYLMRYWQLAKGCFSPRSLAIGKCFSLTNNNDICIEAIIKQKYHMICLNDNGKEEIKDFNEQKRKLKEAFETILGEKSKYEL